ncbi:NAD-dependent epimerase/dehydratase family protein [Chondromyces apiculatus]|uniref:UDP-glucose 4-epimerase n=1 Tax=Chondromyces apiculatus DSM 436 TaxID=1192034 RepID=A0A017T036_9BACT|nr:NAD(P)-dependent oxidoreductase [Chondromyces apiculatus]EYF01926.1 UDP-glucose 4-epimerase [Chondromyces apiculatus DSM 436]
MSTAIRTALVTGATGFIGAALCRKLSREGVRTVAVTRALTRASSATTPLAGLPGVTLVETPSFEVDPLREALRGVEADVVFHLAAYGVHPDQRDSELMIEGNVDLVARLLLATEGWPLRRFLHAGTCSEYAPAAEPDRLTEAHPLAPQSLYGAAKVAASVYGAAFARKLGVPFVTLRLFGVYGPGEGPHRLIPYLVQSLARVELPSLTGGAQARDMTYIDDVADAFLAAARAPELAPYEAYNLCSGVPVRIRDIALTVAELLGRKEADLGLGRRPYRSDEPMWLVGDGDRFQRATGWRPGVSLDEGLRRATLSALEAASAGSGTGAT